VDVRQSRNLEKLSLVGSNVGFLLDIIFYAFSAFEACFQSWKGMFFSLVDDLLEMLEILYECLFCQISRV
jgi:hypothetical protein